MTTTQTALDLNRYGFPIVTCRRCMGSGEFGPKVVQGGVCFGCAGHRVHVRGGKAAKAWHAYLEAARKQTTPLVGDLQPGDQVTDYYPTNASVWRTVAVVDVTAEEAGWSITHENGVEVRTTNSWRCTIGYTDGTSTDTVTMSFMRRRKAPVDPAPFLATIPKSAFYA